MARHSRHRTAGELARLRRPPAGRVRRLADWPSWEVWSGLGSTKRVQDGGVSVRTLPKRAWGTVREDYSVDGDAWGYFPFEHAHSRTYRWSEDGLGASHQTGWTGLVADLIVRRR